MSGAFSVHSIATAPEPKETTRLRLFSEADDIVAHLSAMTVAHGGMDHYFDKIAKLGEDPLRSDADPEAVWAVVSSSKKPIGLLLMDQSVIAGVGNIYRAEILFKSGVHAEQPACSLPRDVFDSIWRHSVDLLRRGFETGSILTVDEEEAKILGPPWTRRYIYNQATCGRCGGRVLSWDMASRTVYACGGICQPLRKEWMSDIKLAPARRKALGEASQAKQFKSHCAPDDVAEGSIPLIKLTVAELKERAKAAGVGTSGTKAALVARLEAAAAATVGGAGGGAVKEEEAEAAEEVPTPAPKPKRARTAAAPASPLPRGGTEGITRVATAAEAAREKLAAGEGRGVEHVALHDDEEAAVIEGSSAGGAAGRRRRTRS